MNPSIKIEEAHAHIKEAEKSLKTGLLKWKPDYDQAADEYNYAATCYKTARMHAPYRDCLLKASENYQICKSYFSAAKCYEQAAIVSKELKEMEQLGDLSEKAAVLYRNHGVPETAVLALEKGAKMIEEHDVDKAVHLYRFAVDIISTEDKIRQAAEVQSKISRLLVKHKRFDEAVHEIRKEMGFHQAVSSKHGMGRLTVCLVMCELAKGDSIAAEKAFKEWGGTCENEEARTVTSLLEAFYEQNWELACRALNQPFIHHMDIEYARLAKELLSMIPKESNEKPLRDADLAGVPLIDEHDEELSLC